MPLRGHPPSSHPRQSLRRHPTLASTHPQLTDLWANDNAIESLDEVEEALKSQRACLTCVYLRGNPCAAGARARLCAFGERGGACRLPAAACAPHVHGGSGCCMLLRTSCSNRQLLLLPTALALLAGTDYKLRMKFALPRLEQLDDMPVA